MKGRPLCHIVVFRIVAGRFFKGRNLSKTCVNEIV